MKDKVFSIKILDSNFDLVTMLKFSDLQWDREFHKAGKFVVDGAKGHVPFSRSTWKYVYSEKRKELGKITQANWKQDETTTSLTLSGYFVEDELSKMIVYPKPTHFYNDSGTNAGVSINKLTDTPEWVSQKDTADVVARAFFNGFKHINFTNYAIGDFDGTSLVTSDFELDIDFGTIDTDHGSYNTARHTRNGERLSNKLYNILKPSYASYEVVFDYLNKTKTLNIIHGVDRTQNGHAYGVNPIVLTSKNGSIKTVSVMISDTDTKDAVIQKTDEDDATYVLANSKSDSIGRFIYQDSQAIRSEYDTDDAYKLAVMSDASSALYDKRDITNISFDYINSSYEYMTDFDLGDIISVDVPEIDLSADVQIVGCHEVIKQGVWSLNLEVGTPIIRKRGKM